MELTLSLTIGLVIAYIISNEYRHARHTATTMQALLDLRDVIEPTRKIAVMTARKVQQILEQSGRH